MPDLPELGFQHLDEKAIVFITRQMSGISKAEVRFVGQHPEFEEEFLNLLLGLGVSASFTHLGRVAPELLRMFRLQFSGNRAVITVDRTKQLMG
ncbi:hypothetical protein D2T31_04555 [Sinirhodobacter populi]|uniref:Uncharacterized protein n=1 Tax=Paenirhodobacter populi TaxID=2306993 RepID=A0A443KF83_9RHOB|nr:hypothetical protein [Sinirhodobacter populi]RWR31283.1 hypothetical protein D2T31_04555 [Sinirhodobacter populi]